MPYMLELFTHPGCISRACGKQIIKSVLQDFPGVELQEIDMATNQKRSEALGVRMSPTLVFDDKIIAVGIPAEQTLRTLLKELLHDKIC